jgi:hypothetical protein
MPSEVRKLTNPEKENRRLLGPDHAPDPSLFFPCSGLINSLLGLPSRLIAKHGKTAEILAEFGVGMAKIWRKKL